MKTCCYAEHSRLFVQIVTLLCLKAGGLQSFDIESAWPLTCLAQIAQVCLNCDGKFQEQTKGVGVGSPLSLIAVNLCVEHFEKIALETADVKQNVVLLCG